MGLSSPGILAQLFHFVEMTTLRNHFGAKEGDLLMRNFLPFTWPSCCRVFCFRRVRDLRGNELGELIGCRSALQPSSGEAQPSRDRLLTSVVRVARWILLFVPALWVGGFHPHLVSFDQSCGSLHDTVWPTLVVLTALASGAEIFCRRHRAAPSAGVGRCGWIGCPTGAMSVDRVGP